MRANGGDRPDRSGDDVASSDPSGHTAAAHAAISSVVRIAVDRWKLPVQDAARLLWLSAGDVRRLIAGRPITLQGESVARALLIDEVDALLALQIGRDLIPYWLRSHSPRLGMTPMWHMIGETRLLHQLQRRLRLDLTDRLRADDKSGV